MVLILPSILIASLIIFKLQSKFLPEQFERWHLVDFGACTLALVITVVLMGKAMESDLRERVSDNRYNVELSGDGAYEFVRAFFANELDYETFYVTKDNINIQSKQHVDNQNELSNVKPNVIIITVESLNAEYLSIFGGEGLTPHLDKLVDKSYLFTRMYATGTRTVRGLEAITLSLPPSPGQSIIRRANNDNLSSLGDAFRQNDYVCDFIYGGYGYFDNMNDFFEGNGYNIKDRTGIPDEEIMHETIWGVADEVLFTQVLKSMDEHFSKGEHAFEMVMTTSNHRPFTFPEGRVSAEQGQRPSAVQYTDWAINDFLERASTKPWFNNTVFVIIADHQARVAGKTNLPINLYHIPCLIYSPALIAPDKCNRLISQSDLAPTLLGMLGLSYDEIFLGHDINRISEDEDRVFISTYQLLGYVKNNTLIILAPNKQVSAYHIDDWLTGEYSEIDPNNPLVDEAVTYYQGSNYLFKHDLLKCSNSN